MYTCVEQYNHSKTLVEQGDTATYNNGNTACLSVQQFLVVYSFFNLGAFLYRFYRA